MLTAVCLGQTAFAAKTLRLSKDVSVTNTGDDAARTAVLDLTLEGANDVNGLVFTLVYNPEVFTFEGLEKGGMPIDDGSTYDPENPPSAETIASTLYYQVNNRAEAGIVMIAAAAANFFTTSETDPFTVFKAKFKVKTGMGSGSYPINIQKTIIGPDTAANAGYDVATMLAVAASLAPDADPKTAQSFEVAFDPGRITLSDDSGFAVSGTAVYGADPKENVTSGVARLLEVTTTYGDLKVAEQTIKDGTYAFSQVPTGAYKVEILSTRPGYQKQNTSAVFNVTGEDQTVPEIVLAKFASKSGTLTIDGTTDNISGLRVVVKDGDGNVVATATVDENGRYVTPPLENPLPAGYQIFAVYGTEEIEITDSLTYDWEDLPLGTVSGTITGLCDGQVVEVLIRSEITKIQKSMLITGDATNGNPYTLSNLLEGDDYILSVVGDGIAAFYDGADNFSDAAKVSVTKETDTAGRDFAFTCGDLKTISGKVTIDGNPVADTTVRANNYNFSDWQFSSAQTNDKGEFTIQVAPSADYYVYVEQNSLRYFHKAGQNAVTVRSDATQVDVSATSEDGIDIPVVIAVPDTAKLNGHVTLNRSLANNGIPLENYLVVLLTQDNVPTGFISRTGQDGAYAFTNVPPGTYNVSLKPPSPYAEQIREGVVLKNDETSTADFIVDQYFRVTGAVKDSADNTVAVPNARVNILKNTGGNVRLPVFTNTQGIYNLYDIPSGVYTLAASHPEYFPAENKGVQVISNVTANDILMTKGAVISGKVTDTNGDVANATVTLSGPDSVYVKATKTNAQGEYQFNGLVANSPHLIKAAKGTEYAPYDPDVVNTGNTGSITPHNMTLIIPATTWTFAGTVTEGGNPVNRAYVLLFSSTTGYRKVVQTNATGAFTFTKVIQGTDYSLLVLPGKGKPEVLETNISITADKTDYSVAVPTIATISGTITLSAADATALVIAGAYDPATKVVHQVVTHNPSGDDKTFTYDINVKGDVDYKVFAQDMSGTFPLTYHGTDGTFANATDVKGDNADIDITMTK
jgi:hypothetical protein